MEEDTILVLFDLCGDFEEGQNDGGGLRLRKRGMVQRVRAQSMVQGIGRPREDQPHGIGQEGRRGRAIPAEVTLDRLESVCTIPPGTIELFVDHLGGRSTERGDDKAWVIARAHDFRREHDSPWLCPGLCSIDERVIEAATNRRRLAMGLGQCDPLVMETPRLLDGGSGLAEQDGIASEAKDKMGPPSMCEHVDDLWSGTRTIATDQEVGVGPVAASIGQEPH